MNDFVLGFTLSSEVPYGNRGKILTITPGDPAETIQKLNRIIQRKLDPNVQVVIRRVRRKHGRDGIKKDRGDIR